jgi:hypothetical protein
VGDYHFSDQAVSEMIAVIRTEIGRNRVCACHTPALGHVFGDDDLACGCGVKWESHQQIPTLCEIVLSDKRRNQLKQLRSVIREVESDRECKHRAINKRRNSRL